MSALLRRALALLALLALLVASPAPRAAAGDDGDDEPQEKSARCTCATRNACWHYLRAPTDPPGGPCWCPKCDGDHRHDGSTVPDGWNAQCFQSKSLDCFLRRHAASWRIACSDCLSGEKCCDFRNHDRCPACGEADAKDPLKSDCYGKDARAAAAERAAVEQKVWGKRPFVVLYSRHFYVVTDVQKIQIRTQQGGLRYVDAHEYGHVMLERAEKAYREFDEAFRGRIMLTRPMGIFLPQRETTMYAIRETYFRNKNAPMIYSSYGGQSESNISGGFCLNGLCIAVQTAGGDDENMHYNVRHLIGNILVTCWVRQSGDNKTMPRWAFEGVAHWLAKQPRSLADLSYAWYCIGEEKRVSGSGRFWMKDLVSLAATGKFGPADEFFSKSSLGQLTYEDHKRAWGLVELCMAEWRGPFVEMLADVRREVDFGEACRKHLGCSPEELQQRYVERLLGLRKTIDSARAEKPDPNAGKLVLAAGDTPEQIASKIRALYVVSDPAVIRQVIDVIGRFDDDLVRESAMQCLRRVVDPAARRAIWEHGLVHADRWARVCAARVCRKLRLAEAKEALRKLMDDPFWMAKCEAALALGTLKDFDAQARMRELVEDPSDKVRIGAMDALALIGPEVNDVCVPVISKNVGHVAWQVRIAACQSLRQIGDEQCIDALVGRFQIEAGRVAEEILKTLRSISGEDLGLKPESWKKWWEREGPRAREHHGFDKKPDPGAKANERYGFPPETPRYYGVELFSQRVGFVLDVSRSTNRLFNPDVNTKSLLHKRYEGATIFQIAAGEVAASVDTLDPRAYFNVIAFGSDIRRWQKSMVQATDGNKQSAGSFVHSYDANGETNFYGAMCAALDLDQSPATAPDVRDTLDTMVFLTDGTPTRGAITDADMLLEWYTELNRYYRVRTHVFAFGRLEVDEDLLRKLAALNDGRFTQLFEEN